MAVISVIGAPGVGKSFLVKRLAALNSSPAFLEGEDFPGDILKKLNSSVDTEDRYAWLCERYRMNLQEAKEISRNGIDCYVDGDVLSVRAWLQAEIGDRSPPVLKRWLADNKHLGADHIIFLYMDEEDLIRSIRSRGRATEQDDFILQRALRIQRAAFEITRDSGNVLIVDRNKHDLFVEEELLFLNHRLKELIKKHV